MPSRTVNSTWALRGSAATCALKAAIGSPSSKTRPPCSVLSATISPRSREPWQDGLVVVDVAGLVGVHEDEVEGSREGSDRVARRPDVDRDLAGPGAAIDVGLRHGSALRVELERVDVPVGA